MAEGALDGIRVIDLTHHIAGPYCTKLLADFGAEVIKVERPGGDPARRMEPFYHDETGVEKSLLFLYLNTSKQGITLNLKSRKGRELLESLVKDADVLVENFSPRVMPSLGLDYAALSRVNPSLVMTSVSNFGQTGSYRDYKAADIVEYALGGLMYIFGAYHREPLKHAFHQAQFKAGTNAASATLLALYHQRLTGEGQHVDVSIQESMASALRDVVANYNYTGAVRRRQPNHSGDLTRIRQVSDGYILPNPNLSSGGVPWETVAEFMGVPELLDDKFNTPSARLENAEELGRILDRAYGHQKKFDTFYEAHKLRFIYGVVQSPDEVLTNSQYQARGYFVDLEHPEMGTVKFPGAPFIMSDSPWQAHSPSPTLGQHNQEVFCQRLGLSREDLVQLRALEVI